MRNTIRALAKKLLLLIVVLILLGYISDLISARICERRIARRIAFDIYKGQEFFILRPKPDDLIRLSGESLKIFQSVGAHAHAYTQGTTTFDGFPWGDVHRATIRFPFIVSVHWGYVEAPLSGEGGSQMFLCLFGIAIPLFDSGGWVT